MKAFPYYWTDENNQLQMADGMDLRDYFAAKVMQGQIANPDGIYDVEQAVRWAYIVADKMIETREQP